METETRIAPFRIRHHDGREYDLEGAYAVDLFEEHYHPQGFQIVKEQPFYGVVPEGLTRMIAVDADEYPDWFVRRQEKSDDALPPPMQGEKAGEYDARLKAEQEALDVAVQEDAIAQNADLRDVSPIGDTDGEP